MEKMVEDLLNRGYAYDTFREGNIFDYYEGMEADVDFWYGKYCENVFAGVNDPDEGIVEYIAGKIDEEHPTENPEQFNSLMRWVRSLLPEVEKKWSVSIREAQIGGTMQYTSGEASGRALAGANADKGIRDVTPGTNGRGQAEVDKTGVYVGIPMGPDKTAWANPAAVGQAMPNVANRAKQFQKAYAAAPAAEKAAMQDWSPEKPDMSMNKDGQVVDNNAKKIMPTQQTQAKSSILQKLGFKESLFEEIYGEKKSRPTNMKKELFEAISGDLEGFDEACENDMKDLPRAFYENCETTKYFESLMKMNEASANATANAIAKQLNAFDGTDAGAQELVKYISRFLGQAAATGTSGLQNDLPGFYQNHKVYILHNY